MASEAPKPGSDLTIRFAAGVAMAAVALGAIIYGGWAFRLLVAAGAAVMLIEWANIKQVPRAFAWAAAGLAILFLGLGTEWLFAAGQMDEVIGAGGESVIAIAPESFDPVYYGLAGAAGLALLIGLASRRAAMAWGFVYIVIPAFALLVLSWAYFGLVLWAMVVTVATDVGAYAAGRTIGGPKLAPAISPNKTWAGLAGGVMAAALVGWLVAGLDQLPLGAPFLWLGAPMAVVAQLGDLYESWEKRRSGVKDSGTILPGHGGVLDRVDGLLPVALLTLGIVMAGLWTG